MTHAYDPGEYADTVRTYRRVHATSEQTHILMTCLDDEHWIAVAVDTDPRSYEPVASELIAYDPTRTGAEKHAERWMQDNPKGVAANSGGGILRRALSKLAAWGEQMNEQQQQPAEDNQ